MNNSVADHDTGISLVEQVYRKIKNSILSNEYSPGYQALEPEIAKDLGVSRTPVREALIRLEAEKLIELIPRRGMRVLPLLPTDIIEINNVLTGLELTAVEALASRKPSKDVLQPMLSALDEMDAAIVEGNLSVWADADETFHRLLVALSGNRRLAGLLDTVRAQVSRARKITLKLRNNLRNSNVAHRALYEQLLAGDVEEAKAVHYAHRKNVTEEITKILETYQFPHL
ncbi:GntR family transcriptional regulator [Teredinibacter sp. KSP-S5-2]|uniref:GntR family transcriptional regulator n=1 Tax=Teredinibacter sp. KSP-S5-2 TaxID=3034506 RepID=UPI00293516AE|nr:GntR family transcriptional regulator [Teredinibacter sp. KSP-S5-2]WNO08695.1 GntR family transcriptional regulator [Teredinibacter sp. KSP-S5-2]